MMYGPIYIRCKEMYCRKTRMGAYIYRHLFSLGKKCKLSVISMHLVHILTTVLKENLNYVNFLFHVSYCALEYSYHVDFS